MANTTYSHVTQTRLPPFSVLHHFRREHRPTDHFLKLPSEIRAIIYSHVFPTYLECEMSLRATIATSKDENVPQEIRDSFTEIGMTRTPGDPDLNKLYALLATCRTVREEALQSLKLNHPTNLQVFVPGSEFPTPLNRLPILLRNILTALSFLPLSMGVMINDYRYPQAPAKVIKFELLSKVVLSQPLGTVETDLSLDTPERLAGQVSQEDAGLIIDTALKQYKRPLSMLEECRKYIQRHDGKRVPALCMVQDFWSHKGECTKTCASPWSVKHENDRIIAVCWEVDTFEIESAQSFRRKDLQGPSFPMPEMYS
ncbi:hypothetical protein OHC33_000818 [Knufia fluminis]|uniref:F-box domain-containing protein n=1 Tax=Knufia fluminis TaxID=191047 RepID=A0AAN8F037_9EURO|nr:hypothetical protein OHC33_000818 [Knufia fluminis]